MSVNAINKTTFTSARIGTFTDRGTRADVFDVVTRKAIGTVHGPHHGGGGTGGLEGRFTATIAAREPGIAAPTGTGDSPELAVLEALKTAQGDRFPSAAVQVRTTTTHADGWVGTQVSVYPWADHTVEQVTQDPRFTELADGQVKTEVRYLGDGYEETIATRVIDGWPRFLHATVDLDN